MTQSFSKKPVFFLQKTPMIKRLFDTQSAKPSSPEVGRSLRVSSSVPHVRPQASIRPKDTRLRFFPPASTAPQREGACVFVLCRFALGAETNYVSWFHFPSSLHQARAPRQTHPSKFDSFILMEVLFVSLISYFYFYFSSPSSFSPPPT